MPVTSRMRRALVGADVFDGHTLYDHHALLLDGNVFAGVVPIARVPAEYDRHEVHAGVLMPGFVDLQVNGGGGILFNEETTVEGLRCIARAHATTGTRALLPTLVTDTSDKIRAAIDAVDDAIAQGVEGIMGLHLEGPHIALARKGAHAPELIRPMTDEDEALLCAAAQRLANLMVTLAPETVSPDRIARLTKAGVIVSLGHSDCTYDQAAAAIDAGARCVTHLFNAMSQLGSREPGLVGAALDHGSLHAGLIADAIHVHPRTIRAAISAKTGPGALFLVSDAMATAGSEITEFQLNERRVLRRDGRLTLSDGTLAGADLDLSSAVALLINRVGITPEIACAMASSGPAQVLRTAAGCGVFTEGQRWNGIHLDRCYRYDARTIASLSATA